jgi:hypothetical protein
MATIKKAQLGGLIKKGMKAATKTTPKKNPIAKRAAKLGEDYDNLLSDESLDWANSPAMKHYLDNKKPAPNLRKAQQKVNERKAAQLKEIDDSYDTSGPAIKVKRKTGGRVVKKAQTGTKVGGPTYSNLKVKNPTAKDSLRYKSAYDKVMNNQRLNFPSRVEAEGSQEALKKLKDMKSKSVAKSKSGSRIKKAANGTSLGMKSVKAGFDKNPGVTRADIITAAKGKAKSGAKMAKQAAVAIAMKKAGKTPKKAMMGTMAKPMMKSGGKMTKCRYGCK